MTRTIGASVPRKEDPRLLRGRGRFGDDVDAEGQLYARVVRSPVAHGRVENIDTRQAARAPGITTIVTAADLPDAHRIPVRLVVAGPDLTAHLQPVLAARTVRYVGEPVAVVVGEDPYRCEDAADELDIDIGELTPALDAAQAPEAAELTRAYGDPDAAFRQAAHVTEITIDIGRHSGVPLEPRCLLAIPAGDDTHIYGMTKVPVYNRDLLARMLNVDQHSIHVYPVDAGGGFGIRGEFYPEDFLIPWLARTLDRPVKWTEDRAEHLVAANHSRQQRHTVSAAFDRHGRLTGLTDEVIHDNGAYCRTHGIAVAELTIAMLPGPYRVPAYRGHVSVRLTNKTPCGTYRAPGRYEGTTAREHLLDVAADQLGIDRVELRRRNLLTAAELPHHREISTLGTKLVLDTGDYPALLDAAIREADRLGYRVPGEGAPGESAPGEGAHAKHGFGLAMFVEKSGLGPRETADVAISEQGTITVHAGGTTLGQGIETVLAQIAAEALGTRPELITVTLGDTDKQPFGTGSWASRSTVVGGSAVHQAALAVRQEALKQAAKALEAAEHDLDLVNGEVVVRGDPAVRVSLAELAKTTQAGLTARRTFEVDHMTYPYGVHAAVVSVDEDTGAVSVLRYLVAYEVGRAVNPMLVEGQLRGGVAQGIGGALLEEFGYDADGQPRSVSFMDYRMPTAAEIPRIDVLLSQDHPSPGNPLGVMGAGEGGINAVGAAIANAVRDALGRPGPLASLPLTPSTVRRDIQLMTGIAYVSKTDLVVALIREQIITGELSAGEQLRQRDLAQRFGVSQTPVREAMRRLESEGLLLSDTHRGFTVVSPDDGPLEENFQIRAALESLGASLAATKIDAAGLARLEDLNARMRDLADDDPAYPDLNREFHFAMYEYARSPLLLSLMRLMWASLHGGPKVSRTHAESARQHDEILTALRAGDAAAAARHTRQHIMGAR